MKLKNKKTGEIVEICKICHEPFEARDFGCNSLAELNEEWENVPEEPKSWWYIDCDGEVFRGENADKEHTDAHKSIGNYYASSKEAEKAVEKLKAWKRLKDNGFEFEGTNNQKRKTGYFINYYLGKSFNSQDECEQAMKDLDLLFGGEE